MNEGIIERNIRKVIDADPKQLATKAWYGQRSNADDLREAGLMVAVHNDYNQEGKKYTFWLMTFVEGERTIALKGEGETDYEALDKIRMQLAEIMDKSHHAPLCPANHYHGMRAPTGPCSCGAVS